RHRLGRAAGDLRHRRIDADGMVFRRDHRVRARAVRHAQAGAQVVRVGDTIQYQQQRRTREAVQQVVERVLLLDRLHARGDALVLVIVFLAGFAAAGFVSRELLLENARDEVIRDARLMMEAAGSVRTYTVDQIRPHLIKQLEEVFLPQTVPAYAATETINTLRKKYSEYSYKE